MLGSDCNKQHTNKMMPNMNSKQMAQAMKRMGIQQKEMDADEVIIKCKDKTIVIKNPSVSSVNMMGQKNYQISGNEEILEQEAEINEDDIQTVIDQTGATKEIALKMLKITNGDIAEAILNLKEE